MSAAVREIALAVLGSALATYDLVLPAPSPMRRYDPAYRRPHACKTGKLYRTGPDLPMPEPTMTRQQRRWRERKGHNP